MNIFIIATFRIADFINENDHIHYFYKLLHYLPLALQSLHMRMITFFIVTFCIAVFTNKQVLWDAIAVTGGGQQAVVAFLLRLQNIVRLKVRPMGLLKSLQEKQMMPYNYVVLNESSCITTEQG